MEQKGEFLRKSANKNKTVKFILKFEILIHKI